MIFYLTLLITFVNGFRDSTDNKYLVMSTSKFWFNIRQSINALIIYQSLKDMGISDDNIILMIPEQSACNSKNYYPGIACPFDDTTQPNVYRNIEIDYKSNDVDFKKWVGILRGKYSKYTPQSRRLKLNKYSRLITYSSGHGGDGYMKMQDTSYLLDFEVAKIFKEMEHLNVFKEAFLISDSCSAITLYEKIEPQNQKLIVLGSSSANEKSYSSGKDNKIFIPKTDKFSLANYNFFQNQLKNNPKLTVQDMFNIYDPAEFNCHAKLLNYSGKDQKQIQLKDYFSVQRQSTSFQMIRVEDQDEEQNTQKYKLKQKLKNFARSHFKEGLNKLEVQNQFTYSQSIEKTLNI